MKKILSLLLVLCISYGLFAVSGTAAYTESSEHSSAQSTIEQTIKALGIIVGDENGNTNLSAYVTRAEFCKMMTVASIYKDSVSDISAISVFKDVKYTHWAAGYIKTAVESGWVVGYVDGNFKPGNNITLEEAASALLRMLGYTSEDLPGPYPSAQLSKFNALKLNIDITKTKGQLLTRADCMQIFYNLMGAQTKNGAIYGVTLGYTVTNGKIDYSALVQSEMSGPFIVGGTSITSSLPFSSSNISVYLDGELSSLSAIKKYDVYYYNKNLRTIWAYNKKAVGQYTEASPSATSPTSVTIAGISYIIGSSDAAYKLSILGEFSIGDTVTLLLGMDGKVVDALSSSLIGYDEYGLVTANEKVNYTDNSGKIVSENKVSIVCTDGVMRQYMMGTRTYAIGIIVHVSQTNGVPAINELSTMSTSGKINASATKLGTLEFSNNIQILDTTDEGEYSVIYPSRLADVSLEASDVRYYTLDATGDIDRLILNDVTGDAHTYGIVTSITEQSSSMSLTGNYAYIINGTPGVFSLTDRLLNISEGPAVFLYKDVSMTDIKILTKINLNSLSNYKAISTNTIYPVSQNVQVYELINDEYYLSSLSTVSNTDEYAITGYVDTGYPAGNHIRVIIAKAK